MAGLPSFKDLLAEDDLRGEKAAAHQLGIPGLQLGDVRDVALRDDEDVHGSLRIDIPEREDGVVLVLDIGRVLSRDDAAENAVGHEAPRTALL